MSKRLLPFSILLALATVELGACDDESTGGEGDAASDTGGAGDTARDRGVDLNLDGPGDLAADSADGSADGAGDAETDGDGDAEADGELPGDAGEDLADGVAEDVADEGDAGDAAGDAATDAGGDGSDGASPGLCSDFADDLVGALGTTVVLAADACVAGPCADCAAGEGGAESCGVAGTLAGCVLDCFVANDFGDCDADDLCTDGEGGAIAGQTCDTVVDPETCRNDLVAEVQAAVAGATVDTACLGCYAEVPSCLYANGCGTVCASPGCGCDDCACDNGCAQAFGTCSGLADALHQDGCDDAGDDDLQCVFGSRWFCAEVGLRCE